MRTLKALGRLARAVAHALHGVAIVLLLFRRMDEAARQARITWWAAKMLRVLGVQRVVEGAAHPGPVLMAINHVSWLDIMTVHSVCPQARFVSKADVRHWPVIRHLVDAAGTLYIERERKRDALRVVHQMAEALQRGQTVAVFPEGTTGEGRELLPFHANLLQAAIAVEAPVQPVALRFSDPGHWVSPAAAYVGDTTLLHSLWNIACADKLAVHISLLPPLGACHMERRALAEQVRAAIGQRLAAR
jgi:1-acyl-sn-glycerol-3-phosphate acyltransferase